MPAKSLAPYGPLGACFDDAVRRSCEHLEPEEQRAVRKYMMGVQGAFMGEVIDRFGAQYPAEDDDNDAEVQALERQVRAQMEAISQYQASLPSEVAQDFAAYLEKIRPGTELEESEAHGAKENARQPLPGPKLPDGAAGADVSGLYSKLGSAVSKLENIYQVKAGM